MKDVTTTPELTASAVARFTHGPSGRTMPRRAAPRPFGPGRRTGCPGWLRKKGEQHEGQAGGLRLVLTTGPDTTRHTGPGTPPLRRRAVSVSTGDAREPTVEAAGEELRPGPSPARNGPIPSGTESPPVRGGVVPGDVGAAGVRDQVVGAASSALARSVTRARTRPAAARSSAGIPCQMRHDPEAHHPASGMGVDWERHPQAGTAAGPPVWPACRTTTPNTLFNPKMLKKGDAGGVPLDRSVPVSSRST